jgi:hypothetical protein
VALNTITLTSNHHVAGDFSCKLHYTNTANIHAWHQYNYISSWFGWKIALLAINNNHSLFLFLRVVAVPTWVSDCWLLNDLSTDALNVTVGYDRISITLSMLHVCRDFRIKQIFRFLVQITWFGWKIALLAINNNHSLFLFLSVVAVPTWVSDCWLLNDLSTEFVNNGTTLIYIIIAVLDCKYFT